MPDESLLAGKNNLPVTLIREAQKANFSYDHYWKDFYAKTGLRDELGIFLPTSDDVSVVISFGRRVPFQTRDAEWAKTIFPSLVSLHQANLKMQFLSRINQSHKEVSECIPMAIADRFGYIIMKNQAWKSQQINDNVSDILRESFLPDQNEVNNLHSRYKVEQLDSNNSIVPDGFLIRELEGTAVSAKTWHIRAMDGFQKFSLTPREEDILTLILQGYDNERIAKNLNITIHAIKAHRKRLYVKCDVSKERELLLMAMKSIN